MVEVSLVTFKNVIDLLSDDRNLFVILSRVMSCGSFLKSLSKISFKFSSSIYALASSFWILIPKQ